MQEIILKVNGMECEGCANRIKKVLLEIDGIKQVNANHTTGEVVVTCDKEVDTNAIKQAIEKLDFIVME